MEALFPKEALLPPVLRASRKGGSNNPTSLGLWKRTTTSVKPAKIPAPMPIPLMIVMAILAMLILLKRNQFRRVIVPRPTLTQILAATSTMTMTMTMSTVCSISATTWSTETAVKQNATKRAALAAIGGSMSIFHPSCSAPLPRLRLRSKLRSRRTPRKYLLP